MITPDVLERMDEAIDRLDIPDATSLKLQASEIICVNRFLTVNRRMIHSDVIEDLKIPPFRHIVQAFNAMKTSNILISYSDGKYELISKYELDRIEHSAADYDGFTGCSVVKKIEV